MFVHCHESEPVLILIMMGWCIRVYELYNGWEDNGWRVAIVAGVKTTSIRLLTSVMGHNQIGRGQKPEINPEMLFVWIGMLSTWMNDRMWVISLYRMSNLKLTICASSAGSDNACCLAHKGSCTHKSSSNLGDKYNKSAKGEMKPQHWHPRPNNSPRPLFQTRKSVREFITGHVNSGSLGCEDYRWTRQRYDDPVTWIALSLPSYRPI